MTDRSLAIRWQSPADGGLEHCVLRIADAGITAEGVVIGGRGEQGYGLRYRVTADADWAALRSIHLTLLGGPTLALRHDGFGEWTDGAGAKRKEFAGLLDVDLGATPLGLIATLKRQTWKTGRTQEIDTLVLAVPEMTLERRRVAYLCLEPGRHYRVGEADIRLDPDGLLAAWAGRLDRIADPAEATA